ncbi:MAG TPA: anhydro-N-acetylmuramic acid kinase [Candidatus Sulfotelmatobacter sp.]|nr:anhydro-N-acetylmuramic acid kinase [Candidatus Sulfotelmatobacter sp.]
MIVAGVMSGTSADGINVALVRIDSEPGSAASRSTRSPASRVRGRPRHTSKHIELLGHAEFAYPKPVRTAVLAAMNARSASVADLSRMNFLLGELYANAVLKTQRRFKRAADLVGCHGQTLYHQGERAPFLGRKINATWQTGEGAVIAARVGVPVVSDFRPADTAAGGKGAPLIPFLDFVLFRDQRVGRVVQNIGGIANLTAIPAGASAEQVVAFDTGPGNMVIDAVAECLFGRAFDRDGAIAASGRVLNDVLTRELRLPFFCRKPPKTAGREEFGREFVRDFLRRCGRARKEDVIATATALTAHSIASAVDNFLIVPAWSKQKRGALKAGQIAPFQEMILSGGGAKNATLVRMLVEQLGTVGISVRLSNEYGLPSEAKEAVGFALLAYETWHRRPSNLPSATGAKRPAVLGKISYP